MRPDKKRRSNANSRSSSKSGQRGTGRAYADQFTEDATYVEHAYGNLHGREPIRDWIVSTMNTFPGSEMPFFPTSWYSIDEDKGWVICEILNRMKDPGDGSIHERPVITVLKYAGDGLWSYEEDAYKPDELFGDGAGIHPALPQAWNHLR